jgi:putative hydrolase of the HAD superfamily
VAANRWDAVVFDYGRVLSQSPTPAEIAHFAALVGLTEPPFFDLYSATRDQYDCGRHDCHKHWQHFANAAGIALDRERVARIVEHETRLWLRVNQQSLDLARELRSHGVQTAILSNMPPDLLQAMRATFAWLDEFAVQIWSCEHGVIKPHAAIYNLCLDALGCEPGRVLFFDDRPRNVEGARKAGMQAHVFESAEQARAIVQAGLPVPLVERSALG